MIRKRRQRFRKVGAAGVHSCVGSDKARRVKRYKSLVELFHGPEQEVGSSRLGRPVDQGKLISGNHGATRSPKGL